jgi:hypothetical protein
MNQLTSTASIIVLAPSDKTCNPDTAAAAADADAVWPSDRLPIHTGSESQVAAALTCTATVASEAQKANVSNCSKQEVAVRRGSEVMT